MWTLSARGWTQRQIGAKYGITQQAVALGIAAYRAALDPDEKAEERAMMREFYRENMEAFSRIADLGPIPAYSNGRPIVDEDADGNEIKVLDYSGVIKAREAAMHAADSVRKMLGLDDASKIESSGEVRHTIVGVPIEDL